MQSTRSSDRCVDVLKKAADSLALAGLGVGVPYQVDPAPRLPAAETKTNRIAGIGWHVIPDWLFNYLVVDG